MLSSKKVSSKHTKNPHQTPPTSASNSLLNLKNPQQNSNVYSYFNVVKDDRRLSATVLPKNYVVPMYTNHQSKNAVGCPGSGVFCSLPQAVFNAVGNTGGVEAVDVGRSAGISKQRNQFIRQKILKRPKISKINERVHRMLQFAKFKVLLGLEKYTIDQVENIWHTLTPSQLSEKRDLVIRKYPILSKLRSNLFTNTTIVVQESLDLNPKPQQFTRDEYAYNSLGHGYDLTYHDELRGDEMMMNDVFGMEATDVLKYSNFKNGVVECLTSPMIINESFFSIENTYNHQNEYYQQQQQQQQPHHQQFKEMSNSFDQHHGRAGMVGYDGWYAGKNGMNGSMVENGWNIISPEEFFESGFNVL